MSLEDQIYAQAQAMAGKLTQEQDSLLRVLCRVAKTTLAARLRDNLNPEDIRADFVAAASLYALATLSEGDGTPEQFTAGELSVRRGDRSAGARCLREQAELMLLPYIRDGFEFLGV